MGHGVAILNALSWGGAGRDDLDARPLTPRLVNRYGMLHLADRGFSRPAHQLIASLRAPLAQTMGHGYLGGEVRTVVVKGRSVPVRVDRGGHRVDKKHKNKNKRH